MSANLKVLLDRPSPFTLPEINHRIINMNDDVHTTSNKGYTVLHRLLSFWNGAAIPLANKTAVRTYIDQRQADINHKGSIGKSPLQVLLDQTSFSTSNTLFLLELGADPNTKDSLGRPLIHRLIGYDSSCIAQHNLNAISTLVNHYKVNIDTMDEQGLTLLQRLTSKYWYTKDALFLVRLGADPNKQNQSGQPMLHAILTASSNGIAEYNRTAIAELVNTHKVDINSLNRAQETPLQQLIGQTGGFKAEDALFLVSLGADPKTRNLKGESLLHLLAKDNRDNSAVINTLIKHFKVDVKEENPTGQTPLKTAIKAIQSGQCKTTANVDALMKFDTSLQPQADKLGKQNKLFTVANKSAGKNRYDFQGNIRNNAFDVLIKSLEGLSEDKQLEKLRWARTQPIFCNHRANFFLARIGRTNTVIKIDERIDRIVAGQSHCGLK